MTTPGRVRRTVAATAAALLTAVTLTAGCSSTVTGTAATESGFTPGDAIPALLNPGNYPTKPHATYGKAGDAGIIVEGQRMADFVVGPWEVDPALEDGVTSQTKVWKDATALTTSLFGTVRGGIASAHGYIVGFSSQRSSAPPGQIKGLFNMVMRFGTPADATAAAVEMGAPVPPEFDIGDTPEAPFGIPGHPDTVATAYTKKDGTAAVQSYTPHGVYVFYASGQAQGGDVDTASALVAKAIDLQGPRIDGFAPTPVGQFGDLPLDPGGLAARTLPPSKSDGLTVYQGVWGPYASLHFSTKPVKSASLNAEAGVVRWVYLKSMVWETKDAVGAKKLLSGFLEKDPDDSAKPAGGVPGLPAAKCFSSVREDDPGQPTFACYYAVDRFVVNVASRQNVDVQQQAAAQYLILTAK
ncbi:hypothetical protein CIW49_26800 [Mycolicibacterium sp. P1-18]|uniref:DUF7373 family lipoprotein n=1 Tax=Mycolicibacterium sp. P1-18 TaxID=2024615 RepID=UPI0011F1D248|nr:hypothetical protein [Mycolicibacterium sp. P1-18]KAA0093659.1 hypothetical protein CIW49_26800 [Mycolicibacterium sp. P1-18]